MQTSYQEFKRQRMETKAFEAKLRADAQAAAEAFLDKIYKIENKTEIWTRDQRTEFLHEISSIQEEYGDAIPETEAINLEYYTEMFTKINEKCKRRREMLEKVKNKEAFKKFMKRVRRAHPEVREAATDPSEMKRDLFTYALRDFEYQFFMQNIKNEWIWSAIVRNLPENEHPSTVVDAYETLVKFADEMIKIRASCF